MTAALRTRGLSRHWGAFRANHEIDLSIEAGARHALIGPNGAGKTTLVNLLTGTLAPTAGDIWLFDERITGLSRERRVKRGLVRTHQISSLFPALTVLESVLLATFERRGIGARWRTTVDCEREVRDEAVELLAKIGLQDEADIETRTLPYGKQRLLEIALALASGPRVLLLDEPAAGIPAAQSGALLQVIADLPRTVTVLFIEHDMDLVFRFAERITVLVSGQIVAEGTPSEISANRLVREVYLGEHLGAQVLP